MNTIDHEAINKRQKAATDMVNALCQPRGTAGSRDWVISIPARPDVDPDLVIGAALADIPALLAAARQPTVGSFVEAGSGYMPLRTEAGRAKDETNGIEYELSCNPGGEPIIRNETTGDYWTISWRSLMELAKQAGLDRNMPKPAPIDGDHTPPGAFEEAYNMAPGGRAGEED